VNEHESPQDIGVIKNEYLPTLYSANTTYPIKMAAPQTFAAEQDRELINRTEGLYIDGDRPSSRAATLPNGGPREVGDALGTNGNETLGLGPALDSDASGLKRDGAANGDARPRQAPMSFCFSLLTTS
jgi:hypothetical protein